MHSRSSRSSTSKAWVGKASDSSTGNPTPVVILVMGSTGSGKSTLINLASGGNLGVGRGLESCTGEVQQSPTFFLEGQGVALIDTPGFDDTNKSDADILNIIALYLSLSYKHGYKIAGVIYLHRISDFRMSGVSMKNFNLFSKICGEETFQNVVIVTNMWGGHTSQGTAIARETELKENEMFFKPVLDKGAKMERHDNTTQSVHRILRGMIRQKPLPLQIQRELIEQHKDISQTAAGLELNREWMDEIKRHEQEMEELRSGLEEATKSQDEETRMELQLETQRLQDELSRVRSKSQKLAKDYMAKGVQLDKEVRAVSKAYEERGRIHVDATHQHPKQSVQSLTTVPCHQQLRNDTEVDRQDSVVTTLISLPLYILNSIFGQLQKIFVK